MTGVSGEKMVVFFSMNVAVEHNQIYCKSVFWETVKILPVPRPCVYYSSGIAWVASKLSLWRRISGELGFYYQPSGASGD
nr:hypothetical protein Iba_chr15fCG1230 [Ipomoea batatas]